MASLHVTVTLYGWHPAHTFSRAPGTQHPGFVWPAHGNKVGPVHFMAGLFWEETTSGSVPEHSLESTLTLLHGIAKGRL